MHGAVYCILCKAEQRGKKVSTQASESYTWDTLEAIGLGEMGMSVEEFYNMTPRQFQNKREGFHKHLQYHTELLWETTRWQAAVNVAPHTKKRISPKDLAVFPWDGRKKVHKAATYDEVQKGIEKVFGK